MISNVLKKIFGSRNDRLIKTYQKTVNVINQFEEKLTTLSDEDLKAKTSEFKEALAAGRSENACDAMSTSHSQDVPGSGIFFARTSVTADDHK